MALHHDDKWETRRIGPSFLDLGIRLEVSNQLQGPQR
jgi:hypothetical protein